MKGALRVGLFSFPRLIHGGGFEEYLIALANSLTTRGHHVSVVNASPHEYRALSIALNVYYRNPLLSDNTRVTADEIRARLGKAALLELPMWKMARFLRRCDVIYAKNELLDLAVLRMLRTARLPPIVCGVHTPMWFPRAITPQARLHNRLYLGRVYRNLLAGVTAIHVSNSYDASLFPRTHHWPPERVIHIPYPYATDADEPLRRTSSAGPLRVVWAARMTHQKGVDTLISIVDAVNRSAAANDYAFVIAGSGDPHLENQVRLTAERYDNVRYLGHVQHDEMLQVYDNADAALVTSNWETFPYACLEPQSRGVLVAASDIPGCADIVEHGVSGFLFQPGDVDAAVAALTRVRRLHGSFSDELDTMRRHALRGIRERFEPTMLNDALEQMLVTVARSDRASAMYRC